MEHESGRTLQTIYFKIFWRIFINFRLINPETYFPQELVESLQSDFLLLAPHDYLWVVRHRECVENAPTCCRCVFVL